MLAGHLRAEVFRHQVSWVGIGANFYHTQLSLGNGLLYPKILDFDMFVFPSRCLYTIPMAADASVQIVQLTSMPKSISIAIIPKDCAAPLTSA